MPVIRVDLEQHVQALFVKQFPLYEHLVEDHMRNTQKLAHKAREHRYWPRVPMSMALHHEAVILIWGLTRTLVDKEAIR